MSAGVTGVGSDDAPDNQPSGDFATTCSFLHSTRVLYESMVLCMDKLADSIYEQVAVTSDEEIVLRFKKVFGREMTSSERNTFFLPNQETTSPSTKE